MESAIRRSRTEQRQANRVAVLAAAGQVFRERGYIAATLDHISEVAGFSKGVVYSRFGSKADLFLALVEQRIDERALEHAAAVRTIVGAHDPVDAVARRMIRSAPDEAAWRLALLEFRLVAARDRALHRRYVELHRQTVTRLADALAGFADATGASLGMPAASMATAAIALEVGLALEDLATDEPVPDDDRVEIVRRVLTPADRTASAR